MKLLASLMLCALCPLALQGYAQKKAGLPKQYSQDSTLREPIYWTPTAITPFNDSDKKMSFNLVTSWIPGEDHKGMLRYRITGRPVELTSEQKSHEMNIPDAMKKFVERAHGCTYDLLLYDGGEFLLRRVSAIPFVLTVDDTVVPVGFSANDAAQIDLDDYRHLSNGGSWNLQWNCLSNVQ